MSIRTSKSIIAVGLICTSLTAVSAAAQSDGNKFSGSDVPLPPPGPFTSEANPSVDKSTGETPVKTDQSTDAKSAPAGDFAPLNFDPEKPASDGVVKDQAKKPQPKTENKDEVEASKPVYAPLGTAKIPVEGAPTEGVLGQVSKDDTTEKSGAADTTDTEKPVAATPAVDEPKKGDAVENKPVAKPTDVPEASEPKYAPAGTAETIDKEAPVKTVVEEKPASETAGSAKQEPEFAPAGTAKIPVPEIKDIPAEDIAAGEAKMPDYAPAGTGVAPPPAFNAPAYGFRVPQYGYGQPQFRQPQYQQPQFRRPQYQQPQFRQPQNQGQRQQPGYAPQYYPPNFQPQQGYWPQPSMQMPPPWGYQQPRWNPQWQQQGRPQPRYRPQVQPQARPQVQQQMQRQGYGFPNPYFWNPYQQQQGWQPRQQGWQQQRAPQANKPAGN